MERYDERHGKYSQAPQETKFQVKATCILYRNGRLSKSSLAQKGTIIINHVFSEAKNYGLMFTLRLAFFYCFLFYASFPHWMELGQLLPSNKGVLTPGPFLRRPSLRRRRRRVHGIHGGFTIVGHFLFFFLNKKAILFFCKSDQNRRR